MKKQKPSFYVMYKHFQGKMGFIDVMETIFREILTDKGAISKKTFIIYDNNYKPVPVRTKEQLETCITSILRYHYWAKCEWEFIAIDWPYSDSIDKSAPVKVDVFDQLEPNIPVITDLVWNYIEDKVNKLIEKDKK